jgi:ATP-dependent helicase HrpB
LRPLPVDALLPQILASLRQTPNLVLEAPPGAGKTTRVPPALLPHVQGEVWVLEPRRLAARLAARRVAEEMGEPVGRTVGYQVRFEQVGNRDTRLRFLTEGVLTRRIVSDPRLRGASVVVLDEFHERHLDTDLALALLRRLQRTSRPDLKLVVMSATLDAAPIAAYLDNCPVLRSEGRLFDMTVRYRPHSTEPLEEQVRQAIESLLDQPGDILVFLPGAAEIRRAASALDRTALREKLLLTPLYGDLSPEEQDRAVTPATQRKVILSTNVAESSITIDGVTAVVDSGLARIASHSPWSGLPVLEVRRISQASATQRAGRSARTAPGRVVRLYPEDDLIRRPVRDTPEIEREDLSGLTLAVKAMGIGSLEELEWLDKPPAPAREAAESLLARLQATDGARLTDIGRKMAQLPLEPRLSRLVVEAARRDIPEDGVLAAALLSLGARLPQDQPHKHTESDLFALLEGQYPPQTRRLASSVRDALRLPAQKGHDDTALRMAILAAFPDRVAKRRQNDEFLLAGGGSVLLARSSTVRDAKFLVAIDVEDRKEKGLPLVRLASAIEPDWLIELFAERVEDRSGVEWNRTAERVEAVSALVYHGLTIDESRGGKADPELAASLLAEKAREAGLHRFSDRESLDGWLARVRFAAQHAPAVPAWTEADTLDALGELCLGKRSLAELERETRDGGLLRYLEARMGPQARAALEDVAPARLRLPNGRHARIEYIDDQPPRLSSRLQDFFGMKETPRVAKGRVPLVLLLLAPNQRPVQTTTDLAGFWQRLYPQVRKELMRRYPRHKWPEKPEPERE